MTDNKATSLSQLSRMDKNAVVRRDALMIDFDLLVLPETYNIRYAGLGFNEYWAQEHVQEYVSRLAHSYAKGDIIPPLVVTFDVDKQKAIIKDGAHRYFGMKQAREQLGAAIKRCAIIESKGDDTQNLLLMINSAERLELSAVEVAEGYSRLSTYGYTVKEIADEVKRTVQHVYQMLKVYDLPQEKKKLIRQKKLTVMKALSGEKPKKFSPPRKVVNQILDLVASSESQVTGDSVKVEIPLELYKQLFDPTIEEIKE